MTDVSILDRPARILFLSCDPARITAQLAGEAVSLNDAMPLRDDVSTDEITPVPILTHFDESLGRFPYTGLQVAGQRPIGEDAIRQAGINVVVGGSRYGKGSSREHSPMAEKSAGVRLVIAQSFERIYRQNADNIGLYTSTDMTLIERLQRGEPITVEDIVTGHAALAAAIVRDGGLLAFGQQHLRSAERARQTQAGPQTLFEKIVYRHLLHTAVTTTTPSVGEGVFVRADWRFIHEYYTGMAAHMLHAR